MNCLALDTAGPFCSAAVLADGRLYARAERICRGHADYLIPMIDGLMKQADIGYPDIDRIGVTVGPGSFTGVRVGLAAARGLAFALEIEAYGFGVLDVLLDEADAVDACAVMDARQEKVFALIGGEPPASLTTLAALSERLCGRSNDPVLIGSSAPALAAKLGRGRVVRAAAAIDIERLAYLTESGEGAGPLRPSYLRPPDAKRPSRATLIKRSI